MQKMPQTLWIAVIFLGAMVLGKIAAVGESGPPVLVDAAFAAVLLAGLVRGCKWAYALTLVATLGGTMWGFATGTHFAWSVLAIDCLVLIPVLICTDYFFPRREPTVEAARPFRVRPALRDLDRRSSSLPHRGVSAPAPLS